MEENKKKVTRKVFEMNKIEPIVWEPYTGETIIVNKHMDAMPCTEILCQILFLVLILK